DCKLAGCAPGAQTPVPLPAAGRSLPGTGHVHRSQAAAGPGPRVPAVFLIHAGSRAAAARATGSPHGSPPLRKRGRKRRRVTHSPMSAAQRVPASPAVSAASRGSSG
ncbi:hypothetical protein HispidOSU_000730, partial [Sigmodon hispidus]